ncbi:MAG TPA: heavy metal-binding domain-containing protein [Gemmataceae bacterium]|jgi:Cu(I)/Ag(I) efflux system membrane fusion protein
MSFFDPSSRTPARRSVWLAVRVLIVRLRFFLVLVAVLLLVGYWHVLRNYWDRWTRSSAVPDGAISADTEYWCPMCPGVVSDWPSKCPVCNMTLVRRKKGESVPLPDGVLARMQFSPYRVQLAGIRTADIEYRPLRREVVLVGVVEQSRSTSAVAVRAEVFAVDLPFLREGQTIEVDADPLPGHVPFQGKIARIESASVRLEIDDPERELRPGTLITARAEAPIMRLPWWQRAVLEEWRNQTAADLALHTLFAPAMPAFPGGVEPLLHQAGTQATLAMGQGAAVPCGAVIDHGARKVVFVENGPGMFDAVEVVVGPRCGDFYPVLRGLETGQRVAATGAFLLDAEMGLDRGLAAAYFGASRGASEPTPAAPATAPSSLSTEDQRLAAKQKTCPVTGEALDAMGGPVRVEVAGRVVFVCCKACEKPLRRSPAKYLAKLPAK